MKNILSTLIGSSILATAVIAGTAVNANAADLTSRGTTCSISDLTTSTDCAGAFSGNDSNTDLSGIFNISNWSEVAKVDMSDSGVGGTDGVLTVGNGLLSGDWSVSSLDFSNFDYMFAVKGGNEFATYKLADGITSGNWSTAALSAGRNGNQPALSHLSLYSTGVTPPPTEVPEPLTILGSAMALGFGGLFKKKYGQGK